MIAIFKIILSFFLFLTSGDISAQLNNSYSHEEVLVTTNNTTQTLLIHTPVTESTGEFHVRIMARRISDGVSKGFIYDGIFTRTTGNTTVTGTLVNLLGSSSDLTAMLLSTATIDANGADIRIRITGLIGTTIYWRGTFIGNEMQE